MAGEWVQPMAMNDFDLLLPKQKAWVVECLSSFPEYQHYAAADCAEELPDELLYLQNMAEEDEDFESLLEEWEEFVGENHIWVLLEQSCDEGVMLAEEFIYARVKDCPREWLAPFETLLQQCPDHVLAYLAQRHYMAVRMDRADRFGKPDWRPADGPFTCADLENYSWKKASFEVRNYTR
jgi:hypothetical protein